MARTRAKGAAPRTGPPRAPPGRWGRAEPGSPRPGLSGRRRWRAPSAALELASPGPEAGLRGIVGGDVGDTCCAQFFVGFLFLFSFSYKKKRKEKIWFPRGRCACLAVPPGGGEARRSALRRRPGGVSSEKGALCGGRAGGQGTWSCFPPLVYSAENRWLLMQAAGREGAPRVPLGSGQVCAPPSPSGSDTSLSGRAHLLVSPSLAQKLFELGEAGAGVLVRSGRQ